VRGFFVAAASSKLQTFGRVRRQGEGKTYGYLRNRIDGAKTYDVTGHYVGRVREFFIEPAEAPNRVSHYLLSRGHFQPLVAKHNQVASVAPGKVELTSANGPRALPAE